MRRLSCSDIVLKAVGLVLLAAAVLKGHELLTVPAANANLESWRPFLILQAECELALAIWLLSGIFKPLAWLVTLACFGLFCCVTLYKGLSGAASCGCFGALHVNPWMTLVAVDLPAVVALGLFRPPSTVRVLLSFLRSLPSAATGGWDAVRAAAAELARPLPSLGRFTATAALVGAALGLTTPILALRKPAVVTSAYEVLEPGTWIGKELPILKHISIADKLKTGTWLILFYHHDCPDCREAIGRYSKLARQLVGREDSLRIAFIEMGPYEAGPVNERSACTLGKLDESKRWLLTTPATVMVDQSEVKSAWEGEAPSLEALMWGITERWSRREARDRRGSNVVAAAR